MIKETPVFVLAGGLGTRIMEMTEIMPKPMVPIGGKPIIWHIMKYYHRFGFRKFVICTGYKSEVIKNYFINYDALNSDFTVNLKTNNITFHSFDHDEDWDVTVAYTGKDTMTGSRIHKAASKYLGDVENFMVTYGDGLTNANLRKEFEFHLDHGRVGTVLAVNPPSRFGELKAEGHIVQEFAEKPDFLDKWINGGYFVFKRAFLKYLSHDESLVLEKTPLVNLTRDRQLATYTHTGFWQCMDTQRDRQHLEQLWKSGQAPWVPQP